MHLDGGRLGGTQVLPMTFIEDTRNNSEPAKLNKAWASLVPKGSAFHNGYHLIGGSEGAFTALGMFGQYCYIHPKYSTVIAKCSTYPTNLDIMLRHATEWQAFHQIARTLSEGE
jgi:hypothetical protein